jgi:hypothetical protein
MSVWLNFGFDVSKYSFEFNIFIPSFDFVIKNNLVKGVFWTQFGPFTLSITDNNKINEWFETRISQRSKDNNEESSNE